MTESIVLMTDERTRKCFETMSAEDAGNILKALLRHAAGEEVDDTEWSPLAQAVYPLIEGQVDRMTELREKRVSAGRAGGESKAEANRSKPVANEKQNVAPVPVPVPVPIKESILTDTKEKAAAPRTHFVPPTVEEVAAYCQEKGYQVDPERFVNFYASKNWYVGKNKMVNWHSAIANWAKDKKDQSPPNKPVFNFTQRQTDYDALLSAIGG